MYLVSRCLTGVNCKYDGGNNRNGHVIEFCRTHKVCTVCPEGESGLGCPRAPTEYEPGGTGRIVDKEGKDVTEEFLRGSRIALEKALKAAEDAGEEIEGAILKAKSPSCGSGRIYDGTFTGTLTDGDGCFTKMLKEMGIDVISEKELQENDKF